MKKDYIEYFRRTTKSYASWKNIPETYKLILDHMDKEEWLTTDSVHAIYFMHKELLKRENSESNFADKTNKVIFHELKQLEEKGYVERLMINELIVGKIKQLQFAFDDR